MESMLVVEDHPAQQRFLARFLPRLGYRVTLAGSGAEALDLLESGQFSLALIDYHLLDMNGPEIARQIRRREALSGKPPLPLVAYTTIEDRAPCLAAGMDAHIPKGDLPKLESALARFSKSFL